MSSDHTAERPWGTWTVLKEGEGYKIKVIEVRPGHRLSLQFHHHRSEHWVVVYGEARVIVGDHVLELKPLESTVVPVGTVHRLENPRSKPLMILELQMGEILSEEDIVRLEDDYRRADPRVIGDE
ncbi:MAG: phosphomannose isomerase type II C-terminal cupin domain [Candidatus Methylomirabilales bacterium]